MPIIQLPHDTIIELDLDKEPEDTLVEPDPEILKLMQQSQEEDANKEKKVEIPPDSEVPLGMKAVVGKKVLTSKEGYKKKGKKEKKPSSPVKYPWHLISQDLNNLGIEELRKKLVIQEIKRSISETLWYDHCITVFGPLKSFLAAMPSTILPGLGQGDHDYSAKDYAAAQEPPPKRAKSGNTVATQVVSDDETTQK